MKSWKKVFTHFKTTNTYSGTNCENCFQSKITNIQGQTMEASKPKLNTLVRTFQNKKSNTTNTLPQSFFFF